jgi:tRNA nucleotidyltransferase (CCA-adding enzyme)
LASSRDSHPTIPVLPNPLPSEHLLRLLGRIAQDCGSRAFLVGGPVRDMLLGLPLGADIDMAVERNPARVGRALARRFDGRFVFHRRFLSGTVSPIDSGRIDIGQTRTEIYPRPGVLPEVKPARVEDDLVRRDFTINALALDVSPGTFGSLLDPHSGRLDLGRRIIRVLHPDSFTDDPTRIFRAIRFAIRLGFEIEPYTLTLMRRSIRDRLPARLSPERILYELRLICAEPLVLQMIEAVLKERLLQACFDSRPSRTLLPGLHRLTAGQPAIDPGLPFVYLLSHLPVTPRFPITKLERSAAEAIRDFTGIRSRLARARRPSTVHRLLKPLPEPALKILSRTEPAQVRQAIQLHLDRLSRVRTTVTGSLLRRLGLRPGPAYRRMLDRVLEAKLDGKVKTAGEETALARKLVKRGSGRG